MDIKENAAYIKGLVEGLAIDSATNEGKVIGKMTELLSDMANKIFELEAECAELREYIEEIDEDLGCVEEDFYVDGDDDAEDDDFEEQFVNDFEDDGSGYDEFVCPSCGETICVDDSLEIEDVICPACGEKIGDIELCDGICDECDGCED